MGEFGCTNTSRKVLGINRILRTSHVIGSAVTVPKRPRCRDYDEKGFCMRGDQCKFDHGSDAVVLEVIIN